MALSRQADDLEADDGFDYGAAIGSIPELAMPLGDEGQNAYLKWGQKLLEKGLLTDVTIEFVISLAIAEHDLARALLKGGGLRYPRDARTAALRKLTTLHGSSSTPSPAGSSNPYARFGFARRARQRRHPQD